jgi:uncharacterized membrane protein
MHFSNFHYLPLAPGFFSILVGLFVILLVLLLIFRALRHAYLSLGVSSSTAMLLLFGSLIGSYFNIPVAELPNEQVVSNGVIEYFGMQYSVPVVEDWAGTVIAVNVGVAVIPTLMRFIFSASAGCGPPARSQPSSSRSCCTGWRNRCPASA